MLNANPTPITPPRVPLIDERTGLIERSWYMFFLSLFRTSQGATDPQLVPDTNSLIASYEAELFNIAQDAKTQVNNVASQLPSIISRIDALDAAPIPTPSLAAQSTAGAVSNIVLTGSPFLYTNNLGAIADVLVSGGGVSLLEFSRDGVVFYNTGVFYGMFELSPLDELRVTYVTPIPTLTLIPR